MIQNKSNAAEISVVDDPDPSNRGLLDENQRLRQELARIEAELKSRKERNRNLSGAINIGYLEWDETTKKTAYISRSMTDIMGMSRESLYREYQREEDFLRLIHPDDRQQYIDNHGAVLNPDRPRDGAHTFDYRIVRPDGSVRHVREIKYGVQEQDGVVIRTYCAIQDLTDYHESMRAQKESEQRYSSLFDKLPLGVQEQDWSSIKKTIDQLQSEGVENLREYLQNNHSVVREMVDSIKIASVNNALLKIYGANSAEELIDSEEDLSDWWDENWANLYLSEIATLAGPEKIHYREITESRLDGSEFEVRLITSIVKGDEDTWERILTIVEDVSERKEAQRTLNYQACHDSLTGLVNRAEFERRAMRLISTFQDGKDDHAMCFMDLDQFKVINDTCGHVAGDELLRQVSQVLQDAVRRRDTLARLGGDEFGILLEHCTLDQAQRVANSLEAAINDFKFTWEGHSFPIGASIGLVAVNEFTPNLMELMRQADAACYMAKELGRNRIHVYTLEDKELALRHGEMQWVARINRALENDEFCLYSQLILPLRDSDHRHYEMLLRMKNDDGSTIPPGAFLPAAERYDLMKKLDCWVIKNALELLAANPDFVKEIRFVSINLSGQTIASEDFLDFILAQLKQSGIEANKICFEITETLAISNLSAARTFISVLKEIGCQFALDDFGSGLSSFGYLKNLPVDYLKIDGIFVKDIVEDPIDRAMVNSINEIGQVMGMKTIAEFVENSEIEKVLAAIGVDYAQGYGVEMPLPFEDLIEQTIFNR